MFEGYMHTKKAAGFDGDDVAVSEDGNHCSGSEIHRVSGADPIFF